MEEKSSFKPFIPAEKIVPEFTATSIVIGVILAVLFGGANAYLGLRVGMTVSASIPAAVISMGIIRVILHRESILENNMVQTIGSAGESVAVLSYIDQFLALPELEQRKYQLARRMGFPLDWKQLYRLKESDLAYIEDLARNTVDEKQWETLLHRYMDRYI